MPSRAAAGRTPARSIPVLLERKGELTALASALDRAAGGHGALCLVEGPAGIGKTALLAHARRAALRRGFAVHDAAGAELERDLPYGVVRQLFAPTLLDDGLLRGAAALAATVVVDPAPAPALEAPHAALHGLHWLAAELAARAPRLLVLDDAHWADAASLRWLAYLGRRLAGVPLLVLAARRPDPTAVQLPGAVLHPLPLSTGAVARCLRTRRPAPVAPALARAAHEASGGNPFLVHELANALPADATPATVARLAPAHVADTVLAQLGAEARRVAEAAAILSTDARLDRVAALAGESLDRTAALADRLAAGDILTAAHPLAFRHPIVRAAIEECMPAQRRGRAHAVAARLLLDGGEPPERVAAHLLLAPPAGERWVAETLRRAATTAVARGAPDAAVTLLRRALAERPDCDVLVELATAEFTVQDPACLAHARQALDAARTPAQRTAAGLAAARALTPQGAYAEALQMLEDVDRVSAELDPAARLAVRLEALVLTSWRHGVDRLAGPLQALRADDLPGDDVAERMVLALRAMQLVSHCSPAEAVVRVAGRVVGSAGADEDDAVFMAARSLALADELGAARRAFDAVVERARARGAIGTLVVSLAMRAEAGLRAGDLLAAETDAEEALAIAAEHGQGVHLAGALATLATIRLEREPAAAVRALLDRFPPHRIPAGYPTNMVRAARGRAAAAAGDLPAAVAELRAAGHGRLAWGEVNPAACAWRSDLALVLAAEGEHDEPAALADEELRLARRFGAARGIGIALRARALLQRGDAQIDGLRIAVRTLAGSPARLEHARALGDLGAALRRAGRRAEARPTLARALDAAHACGATVLAERTRAELRAAGARPRRERTTGPDSLTAAERRVAQLAAQGLTNRQIAQTLFVTAKTVETHLGHIYTKLDVAGRAELEPALAGAARAA